MCAGGYPTVGLVAKLLSFTGLACPVVEVMVSRMSLILWVLEAKRCLWLYKQPQTSLLFQHPRMQDFVESCVVFKINCWMGSYGASSPKGTHLWGPHADIQNFILPLPCKTWAPLVTKKTLADGRVQVSGNGDLKASQTYPPAFGHATVGVWKMAVRRQLPPVNKLPNIWKGKVDKWADADLSDVFQFLSMGTMK